MAKSGLGLVPAGTPPRVAAFWYLIAADFLVDLVWTVMYMRGTLGRGGVSGFYMGEAFGFVAVLAAWLIVRRRIAWLRWPLAVRVLLGFLGMPWHSLRLLLPHLLEMALGAVALVCIFFGSARAWFAARPPYAGRHPALEKVGEIACGAVLILQAGVQVAVFFLVTVYPHLPSFSG